MRINAVRCALSTVNRSTGTVAVGTRLGWSGRIEYILEAPCIEGAVEGSAVLLLLARQ